jgi:hypothetical protein
MKQLKSCDINLLPYFDSSSILGDINYFNDCEIWLDEIINYFCRIIDLVHL